VGVFFSSFDKTTTELGLDAEGLTKTVLNLNLGFICLDVFWFLGFVICFFSFFPFDKIMAVLLPRHQHQDWRMKD
jgi:hypothetical protein